MYGEWTFHVSQDQKEVNLFQTKDVCTHRMPNGLQIIGDETKFQFAQEEIVKVTLNDGNVAQAYFCKSESDCDKSNVINGKWTTVYDQALKVELENGLRFVSNFRYNVKKSISANPLEDGGGRFGDLHTGDYDNFDSECDKTMVGFVQSIPSVTGEVGTLTNHKAVCFHGKQDKGMNIEHTQSVF